MATIRSIREDLQLALTRIGESKDINDARMEEATTLIDDAIVQLNDLIGERIRRRR